MENDIQKVLYSEETIQHRIDQLGELLNEEYADKNPVIIGVLKGVVIFYADMVRRLKMPCQMDFMCISSYKGTQSTGMNVQKDVSADIKGRHVLILEDIFDTGNCLNFTVNHLKTKEPASIKICSLFDKPERRRPDVTLQVDWVGFTVPNEFIVGYGLDYNEHYRNLPYVGVLKPEVYEKK